MTFKAGDICELVGLEKEFERFNGVVVMVIGPALDFLKNWWQIASDDLRPQFGQHPMVHGTRLKKIGEPPDWDKIANPSDLPVHELA
jgi:hypothetical protein